MNGPGRPARLVVTVAAVCLLAAACGGGRPVSTAAAAPAPPPLAASFTGPSGAGWTVVEMGGSASSESNFWQMFYRQTSAWRLATPTGVADNGGLVVTGAPGGSLVSGFVPSQDLTFSPLAASTSSGAAWSAAGTVDAGLTGVPDALATEPSGLVIALSGSGVQISRGDWTAWTRLASARSLAATPAGRACGVSGLTAVAFSPGGAPMLAADCDHPGVAGIFTEDGGVWQRAGAPLPVSLARDKIDVLRLTATGTGLVALLRAGTGPKTSLLAGWMASSGAWMLSAPLRTGGRRVTSTAVGPGGSIGIILNAAQGLTVSPPGGSWARLPALPRWAAALALGPSGQVDALAAHGGTFTDWRLGTSGWASRQTIGVSIPYGSSG